MKKISQAMAEPSPRWIFASLAIYGVLISIRDGSLLLHGRVWAEEGTVYLYHALGDNPAAAFLAPHLGYYALWPNLCALLAGRLLPLSWAALVLVWCAFLIQLLAGYLTVECEAFRGRGAKILALAVLLLAAPSRQVWLNTINSQFYLVVCAAIIYLSRTDRLKVQRNSVLALAALTGPDTIFFLRFFSGVQCPAERKKRGHRLRL